MVDPATPWTIRLLQTELIFKNKFRISMFLKIRLEKGVFFLKKPTYEVTKLVFFFPRNLKSIISVI